MSIQDDPQFRTLTQDIAAQLNNTGMGWGYRDHNLGDMVSSDDMALQISLRPQASSGGPLYTDHARPFSGYSDRTRTLTERVKSLLAKHGILVPEVQDKYAYKNMIVLPQTDGNKEALDALRDGILAAIITLDTDRANRLKTATVGDAVEYTPHSESVATIGKYNRTKSIQRPLFALAKQIAPDVASATITYGETDPGNPDYSKKIATLRIGLKTEWNPQDVRPDSNTYTEYASKAHSLQIKIKKALSSATISTVAEKLDVPLSPERHPEDRLELDAGAKSLVSISVNRANARILEQFTRVIETEQKKESSAHR